MVSRAFQVLSDTEKKSKYDRFGGDPDSRFSSASTSGASPFSGFASQRSAGRAGPMFEEEMSPEELFRQFFSGGMGGPFGGMGGGMGGPGFVFNLGNGPGIRMQQFGGNQPRRRPHNHQDRQTASPMEALRSLLPLLLLFVIPLLSSLFTPSADSGPSLRFQSQPPYTESHTSSRLGVSYFVNPAEVQSYTNRQWKDLDRVVETKYVSQLTAECQWEQQKRQRLANEAQGFFLTDHAKLKEAQDMDMPSCRKLREANGGRNYFY